MTVSGMVGSARAQFAARYGCMNHATAPTIAGEYANVRKIRMGLRGDIFLFQLTLANATAWSHPIRALKNYG